jgi:hypothetical protein
MFGWLLRLFRRKPEPAPVPVAAEATIVVRAAGMAAGPRRLSPTPEQIMAIAVEESHAAGTTDDVGVKKAIMHARGIWKQARAAANHTGKAVAIEIGMRKVMVEPD